MNKNRRLIKRDSYRLVMNLLFIVVVFILTCAILLLITYRQISQRQADQQVEDMGVYTQNIDKAFYELLIIMHRIEKSPILASVIHTDMKKPYLNNTLIHDIINMLQSERMSADVVSSVYIYFFDSYYLITDDGLTLCQTWFENRYSANFFQRWFEELNGDHTFSMKKWNYEESINKTGSFREPVSSLSLIRTITVNGSSIGNIVINLDASLNNLLPSLSITAKDYQMYILDGDKIISSSEKSVSVDRINYGELIAINQKRQSMICVEKSKYFGNISFVTILPKTAIQLLLLNLFYISIAALICVGIAMGFYACFISRKIYMPIRSLASMFGQPVDPESGELTYLRDQVVNMLSANNSLQESLRSKTALLRDSLLFRLILSIEQKPLIYTQDIRFIQKEDKYYNILVVRTNQADLSEDDSLSREINSIITALKCETGSSILSVLKTNYDEYAFVMQFENSDDDNPLFCRIEKCLNHMKDKLMRIYLIAGYGEAVDNLLSINTSYKTACARIMNVRIDTDALIAPYDTSNKLETKNAWVIPADFESQFSELLQKNDKSSAWKYIESFLLSKANEKTTMNAFILFCKQINDLLQRHVSRGENELLKIDIPNTIYSSRHLLSILQQNFHNLLLSGLLPNSDLPIAIRVKEFVDSNYLQNINLETVASALNYNATYLSRIFKQETGIRFTQYLNEKRIISSCKLLRDTSLSVSEIAEMSGYNSINSYIRTFEQYTGISPSKYRNSMNY